MHITSNGGRREIDELMDSDEMGGGGVRYEFSNSDNFEAKNV